MNIGISSIDGMKTNSCLFFFFFDVDFYRRERFNIVFYLQNTNREANKLPNKIWTKGIVIGIVMLFIGASVLPFVKNVRAEPTTVYVDDDFTASTPGWGYDHFNMIQNGVDGVAIGGTIIVYNGTYVENVMIDKPVQLYGENRNSTIIDGGNLTSTIRITADHVVFNGCTVINGNNVYPNAGIYLDNVEGSTTNHNTVSGNNGHGIFVM